MVPGRPAGAAGGGAGSGSLDEGSGSVVGRVPLDPVFEALGRIFDVAADETKVEQPLCLDCTEKVQKEVEAQVREVRAEVTAYEAALAELAAKTEAAPAEEVVAAELAEAEEEERRQRERAASLEAQLRKAEAELARYEAAAGEQDELEQRYWHDFNDFQLRLRVHMEERDALLARTDNASAQLKALQRVNVYSDVFFIWHDGPFGTISGFRLGRTPESVVEWDEINAAWGQAVLLLHTMAQACKVSLSHRLMPMGSYPRVADSKNTYDLFGPVSKLYCATYDRAIVCFLTCLKEFADFAAQRDSVAGKREVLEVPYAIEGDKVGGLTVKLMFNKDARWTKALKFMLTDLKWCQEWVIATQG